MPLQYHPRGAIAPQDERRHDPRRPRPATLSGQHRPEARFDVQASKQVLDVSDSALDLDDEQDPRTRMPGKEVTAAAVAIVVEAHLRPCHPSSVSEARGCRILQSGVRPIDEPIEVGSAPSHLDGQGCVERLRQPRQRAQRQTVQGAPLGAGDGIARKTCSMAEVRLAPPMLASQDTDSVRYIRAHSLIVSAAGNGVVTGCLLPAFG